MLSAHVHKTGQVLAGKGCQRMHATDLDTSFYIGIRIPGYDAAQVRRVCALESSSLVH